ncbi:hypothetical protein G0Q06_11310 [Puniceicoccales bacterium CK1056]|uniref:Glycosyltransferase family 2 protein n=1 Tax=Oceanipulchritudo coccoides TaxID=2706888 RepID=A0A6B2M420_9BACT|nr:hypothetical protein [Oceanipulchritudo coccoides]NDV63042.1 hypothetical protein [Oceanipulchritudo coccoides]
MRSAVLILFYDCSQLILRAIANSAPHVEKIYVSYSPYPWSYNPEAREKFRNPSDPGILKESPHLDKLQLIEGDWATEEDQRNEVLDLAREEGFDILIVQDADEFFMSEDYAANLAQIESNRDFAYFRTPWYQFWKDTRHVILCRESLTYRKGLVETRLKNTTLAFSMAFALNLHSDIRFNHCRRPSHVDDYLMLDRPCYHLSYVLSDNQVERKIRTYGHTNQIRHAQWLRRKWYGWQPSTRCLHPLNPAAWLKAVPFGGPLPKELEDLPEVENQYTPLTWLEKTKEFIIDLGDLIRMRLKVLKSQAIARISK